MGDIIYFKSLYKEELFMDNVYEVANYFLTKESMSHKKIQKLCYYVQAWGLALTGENLMNTWFEAWIHGPVSPELYRRFKNWGWMDVPKVKDNPSISSDARRFADIIYEIYGHLTGDELESLTHRETPWLNARKGFKSWENCTNTIDEEDIKCYYKELLKR